MSAPIYDTIVLGAGAAGMMCATQARGRVLVLDHAKAPGEKIRISGGGRCNFTNLNTGAHAFLSQNPHFAKSALSRYTPRDFLDLVEAHGIPWHEKTLGQLFCDRSAKDIIALLLDEMARAGAELRLQSPVEAVAHGPDGFTLSTPGGTLRTRSLVIATGGKSIPKMGATGFAYRLAEQFGHNVTETRPALVPLTFGDATRALCQALAGVSLPAAITCAGARFQEAMLFTHKGLSGPAILQISSYWREGQPVTVDLLPGGDALDTLQRLRRETPRKTAATALSSLLPKRLAAHVTAGQGAQIGTLADRALSALAERIARWEVLPAGTEGYRTAEVTLGGIDTAGLDARSMESRTVPGLFFIGEAVDVTGWLGGYNFQWAWASGHAAGIAIAARTP